MVASNYATQGAEVGLANYVRPVNTALIGAVEQGASIFVAKEKEGALAEATQGLEAEREGLLHGQTEAQKDLAQYVSATMRKDKGEDLSDTDRALLANSSKIGILKEALNQGIMKEHEYRTRLERQLRTAKKERPDLAPELERQYADVLGFDVRGAGMDYYHFLLKETESQIESKKAQAGAADKQFKEMFKYVEEQVKNLPESQRVNVMDAIQNLGAKVAAGAASAEFGVQQLAELSDKATGSSGGAVIAAQKDASAATLKAFSVTDTLAKAIGGREEGLYINGSLNPRYAFQLDNANLELSAAEQSVGNMPDSARGLKEALLSQLKVARGLVDDARKGGPQDVVAAQSAAIQYAALTITPAQKEALSRVGQYAGSKNATDNANFVSSVAPTIQQADSLIRDIAERGKSPWELSMPSSTLDAVSGKQVGKLYASLNTRPAINDDGGMGNAATADAHSTLDVLSDLQLAYFAKRVNGEGVEKTRDQNELFGNAGMLTPLADPDFVNSQTFKTLVGLNRMDLEKWAASITMGLDRYNASVSATAKANNPDLKLMPVFYSMAHHKGTLKAWADPKTEYSVAHPTQQKEVARYGYFNKEAGVVLRNLIAVLNAGGE